MVEKVAYSFLLRTPNQTTQSRVAALPILISVWAAREHGTSSMQSRYCNASLIMHPSGSTLEPRKRLQRAQICANIESTASRDNLAEFRAGDAATSDDNVIYNSNNKTGHSSNETYNRKSNSCKYNKSSNSKSRTFRIRQELSTLSGKVYICGNQFWIFFLFLF